MEKVTGGNTALIAIGADGRITDIVWNRLPALTNEQFLRLEAILRTNTYPESMVGQIVTEVVDVRGLLGLAPEPDRTSVIMPR
jgi:hypothetical protein